MVPTTIVCGPPGAGKSKYVADRKGPSDLVVDVDGLYGALGHLPNREKPECLLPFVLEARRAVIDLLANGFSLRPTASSWPPHAWVIICGENNQVRMDLGKRLRADVVVLPVPVGACRERMVRQGRPIDHVIEMVEVGVRWHKEFRRQPTEVIYSESMPVYGADGWTRV
jgi:hypothetical protein